MDHRATPVLPHVTKRLAQVLSADAARHDLALVEKWRDACLVTLQEEVRLREAALMATWREYLVCLGLLHVDRGLS